MCTLLFKFYLLGKTRAHITLNKKFFPPLKLKTCPFRLCGIRLRKYLFCSIVDPETLTKHKVINKPTNTASDGDKVSCCGWKCNDVKFQDFF